MTEVKVSDRPMTMQGAPPRKPHMLVRVVTMCQSRIRVPAAWLKPPCKAQAAFQRECRVQGQSELPVYIK